MGDCGVDRCVCVQVDMCGIDRCVYGCGVDTWVDGVYRWICGSERVWGQLMTVHGWLSIG